MKLDPIFVPPLAVFRTAMETLPGFGPIVRTAIDLPEGRRLIIQTAPCADGVGFQTVAKVYSLENGKEAHGIRDYARVLGKSGMKPTIRRMERAHYLALHESRGVASQVEYHYSLKADTVFP